jgi:hypothetical protein
VKFYYSFFINSQQSADAEARWIFQSMKILQRVGFEINLDGNGALELINIDGSFSIIHVKVCVDWIVDLKKKIFSVYRLKKKSNKT